MGFQLNLAMTRVPGGAFDVCHQQAADSSPPGRRQHHQPMHHRPRECGSPRMASVTLPTSCFGVACGDFAFLFREPHSLRLPPPVIDELLQKIVARPLPHADSLPGKRVMAEIQASHRHRRLFRTSGRPSHRSTADQGGQSSDLRSWRTGAIRAFCQFYSRIAMDTIIGCFMIL